MKKILIVVGARPNFIKIARLKEASNPRKELEVKIVHTRQHYDDKMSGVFFKQFNLTPDFYLTISQNSGNTQIAEIMIGLENLILNEYRPDLILVVGDVNSTLAASITANKLNIKIGHIESGLRSFDREMPEEINRILTDQMADFLFITEDSAKKNLIRERIKKRENFFYWQYYDRYSGRL